MSNNTEQRLLEVSFPVKEVNVISMYEMANLKMIPKDIKNELTQLLGVGGMGHNLPKVHNIHYYPARIPTSGARAVTLAAVLRTDVDLETFKKAVGFEELKEHVKLRNELAPLYMVNPCLLYTSDAADE